MKILVDCDGVLADFQSAFLALYRRHGGHVPAGWRPSYYGAIRRLPNANALRRAWMDPRLFALPDPYPRAQSALYELNLKHEVRIVTKVVDPWEIHVPARRRWLDTFFGFIKTDQILIAEDKAIVNGDILVEDFADNLAAWIDAGLRLGLPRFGILVDQEWNRAKAAGALPELDGAWRRVASFAEFAETV